MYKQLETGLSVSGEARNFWFPFETPMSEQVKICHFFTVEIGTKGYGENLTYPAINPFNNHGSS